MRRCEISRRNVTIALVVILTILALATWGGTRLGDAGQGEQLEEAQAQLTAATEELARIQADYTALQQEQASLSIQLATTTASLQELQELYAALELEKTTLQQDLAAVNILLTSAQATIDSLLESNNQLLDQLATLSATVTALQAENASLLAELASADSQYDDLYDQYLALEATRQFVVESRVAVTLHTETQGGNTWIRGEATNISGQTIDKFYLLVAHFAADGTLSPLDLRPIENLGAGDTTVVYVLTSVGDTVRITALSDD